MNKSYHRSFEQICTQVRRTMLRMRNKLTSLVSLNWLLILLSVSTFAAADLPKRTGVVNDYAGVFDAASSQRITALSNELYQKTSARIAVLTVRSLNGQDIKEFANSVYASWGIGQKGKDRGVLILLSSGDRRYRIEVGYGLESILPDGKVGGFGREAIPLFKQQQYAQALELLTDRVATTIADDSKVSLSTPGAPVPAKAARPNQLTPKAGVVIILFFLAFFITIVFVILFAVRKALRGGLAGTAGIPGSPFTTYYDSAGSSSIDSSSDSGSSGGFDGGSSGGGGADGSF